MWRLQATILLITVVAVNAGPTCTLNKDNSALECHINEEESENVISRGLVSDNNNTRTVSLKNCKISSIECQAFHRLPNLNELVLSNNRIHELKPCSFKDLRHLTILNMSYNRISDLPSGLFDTTYNIEELDLKGNVINTIPSDFFIQLTKLKTLDLSMNVLHFSALDSHLFEHNKQLLEIDLSRNDMSGTTEDLLFEMKSLETLKLDRCFLTEIPTFVTRANLRSLKVLIMSSNQISNLDDPTVFVNLDNLEILNLAGNAIESVAESIFAPLRKVKTIVLKQNRLKQLPDKLFQNMPKLVSVDLAFNVLEKIEVTPFKNTGMKNLNISGNKLSFLPENFCQKLKDAGGRLTKFLFVPNPWQCSCLRDIMEEVKRLNLIYNSAKYDGKESVCEIKDNNYFNCVRY